MEFLNRLFHLEEKGTTVKTEIVAGITTFLAMAYILGVNPSVLGSAGMDVESVFTATALSAAIATLIMGLLANYPVALASGMGVNALFAYTICGVMGYSWQAALAAVFLSGVIFVVISVTGVRKMIIDAIPGQLKLAIGAGIGFFIAFVGLKNAEIIVASEGTLVGLGELGNPSVLLALFGLLVTIVCVVRKIPAGVFIGMIVTAIFGLILGFCGVENMPVFNGVFSLDFKLDALGAFMNGFGDLFAHPFQAVVIIFSFLFVDFFDTAGTLVAIGSQIGLVNEKGELEGAEKALLADSIGTVVGSVLGTSTVTTFVESSSGVGVGGKTGLTAVTTAVLFALSIFISPLVLGLVTNAVTAPALIVVGILMAGQLKDIDWDDPIIAVSAFITIISMILTYSISDGIAFGFITYAVAMLAVGRFKQINAVVWVLIVIFILYFAMV